MAINNGNKIDYPFREIARKVSDSANGQFSLPSNETMTGRGQAHSVTIKSEVTFF